MKKKIRFEDDAERFAKKEELEGRARDLETRFHQAFQEHRVSPEGVRDRKVLHRVRASDANTYVVDLGKLADEAANYFWEEDPPAIEAKFELIQIDGSLEFGRAILPPINFTNVILKGNVDCKNATLLGPFEMARTELYGDFESQGAKFTSNAMCIMVRITGSVNFYGAKFAAITVFDRVFFENDVYFQRTSSNEGIPDFESIGFEFCEFKGNANFDENLFNHCSFRNSKFLGSVSFRDAKSLQAFFSKVTFDNFADFSGCRVTELIKFDHCEFSQVRFEAVSVGAGEFNGCTFKGPTDFTKAKFGQCPVFHEASIHQDTSFSGTEFKTMRLGQGFRQFLVQAFAIRKTPAPAPGVMLMGRPRPGISWDREARAYRTLKLLMSKYQAQQEAAEFFAGEMRCRRRVVGLFHPIYYISSLLYDLFSDFGQSAGRVLSVMLLINAGFTYSYYSQAKDEVCSRFPSFAVVSQPEGQSLSLSTLPPRWDIEFPWLALSMQSLNPVAFLSPKNTWVQVYDGGTFTQGAAQSLLNLVLLVLLTISLRGQFRRGGGGGD